MNETKHTPGPWRELYTRIDDASGYQICHLDLHGKSEAERDANRRLISAAPELLAACRAAEQFIRNGAELGYIRMPTTNDPALLTLPMICAAIARAAPK